MFQRRYFLLIPAALWCGLSGCSFNWHGQAPSNIYFLDGSAADTGSSNTPNNNNNDYSDATINDSSIIEAGPAIDSQIKLQDGLIVSAKEASVPPICGDGQATGTEECDATDLKLATCQSKGFYGGSLSCGADCKLNTTGCHNCGNGAIEGTEECDGANFGGKSCLTLGFASGSLFCVNCQIRTRNCLEAGWVHIEAGSFEMGSPSDEKCRYTNEDKHTVTLSKPFAISETEVTQAQYQSVMGNNPAGFKSCGSNCPVEYLSWHEAVSYCNKLSSARAFASCYTCTTTTASTSCVVSSLYSSNIYNCPGFRLPTEAEWEYAYRAGTTTALYNANILTDAECSGTSTNLDIIAWYQKNSGYITHPVKTKTPNAWGLYDMAGNVEEFVHDGYQAKLGTNAVADPVVTFSTTNSYRLCRGGDEANPALCARAAFRFYLDTASPNSSKAVNIGFRCVRTLR